MSTGNLVARFRVPLVALLGWSLVASPASSMEAARSWPARYAAYCDDNSAMTAAPDRSCAHALEIGAPNARRIVIFVPGGSEGAGTFRLVAQYIAAQLPGMQVWVVERREQDWADFSRFGTASQQAYYMNGHYNHVPQPEIARARNLGLADTIADLRRVIEAAHAQGRAVYLGGHSWGATIALAYAAWDFNGHPGYKDLSGLLLVDGGVHDSFAGEGYKFRLTVDDAKKRLAKNAAEGPFTGDIGYLWGMNGAPEEGPIDYQLAASLALSDPHTPSPLQYALPKVMQPSAPVTNAALLGWLIDTHAPVGDLQAHSGHFDENNPHDWVSAGPADINDIAAVFAHFGPAALEWYWPRRLTLDLEAIDPFVVSPATEFLRLPISHSTEINTPLYVFQTGLTHGTVVESTKWVVAHSKIARTAYVGDDTMSHLDPLLDVPAKNKFLSSVVEFLREESQAR
jgi:pimeloyl-ACP methyl ester carboxylesterase